jgi:hypothetical protein
MERNVKISFETLTIDWSYGYVCCFVIKASKGCRFFVDWGDGKTMAYTGQKDAITLQHDYNPRVLIPKDERVYYVKIFSEDENCLFTELIISNCDMRYTNFNISRCVELEVLDCDFCDFTKLDLSKNTALIELSCRSNKLTMLDLRKNEALQVFKCEGNGLTNLMLGRGLDLREVQYIEGNSIKESTKRWIEKLTAANNNN